MKLVNYLGAFTLSVSCVSCANNHHVEENLTSIAFGSCVHQDKPQPIWNAVLADKPDVFIFLGDNIYGDSDDPKILEDKYDKLAQNSGFQNLRESSVVLATWDDHDYGQNDAGVEYIAKNQSRKLMLDFWGESETSLRRTQEGGIYASYYFESSGKTVQVILLDTRWNRSPLIEITDLEILDKRNKNHLGPYEVNYSTQAELLGEAQWSWLEEQVQIDADLRIIGTSIQFISEFTGWESWANFPRDRLRMIDLLNNYSQEPIVFISGDVHWAELSELPSPGLDQPLIELTSSGLTEEWKEISPNRHRVGEAFATANYGLIEIDWDQDKPLITLSIKNESGATLISKPLY